MNILFRSSMPQLDLHGETKDIARVLTEEFINDNYELGYEELAIIHGVGKGILKKEVHNVLEENKLVKKFALDRFNSGQTLLIIDKKQKKCYNMHHKNEGGIL